MPGINLSSGNTLTKNVQARGWAVLDGGSERKRSELIATWKTVHGRTRQQKLSTHTLDHDKAVQAGRIHICGMTPG